MAIKYWMVDQKPKEKSQARKISENVFFIVLVAVMTIFILQTLSEGVL